MNSKLESVLSVVLTIAAVAMSATVVARTIAPARPSELEAEPTLIANWQGARQLGHEIGDSSAAVTIVEFLDLQCPACRYYHRVQLAEFERLSGKHAASFVIVPLPLEGHRHAVAAAIAAECAAKQGRFREFVELILARQSDLGETSWPTFASNAQLGDTLAFGLCLKDVQIADRVEQAKTFATRLGVAATPSMMINGYMMAHAPSGDRLAEIVKELHANRNPFKY